MELCASFIIAIPLWLIASELNQLKKKQIMGKQDIAFCIFYGAIFIAGLGVSFSYWYSEIFKKK